MIIVRNIILLIALVMVTTCMEAAETREKIAIIDTGISRAQAKSKALCENGRVNYTRGASVDYYGHGSNIFGIIEKELNIKTQCIISYQVWKEGASEKDSLKYSVLAYKDALKRNVKFINVSMGGNGYYSREFEYIKEAIRKGIYVVVAAGNGDKTGRGIDLNKKCDHYPACYKKIIKSNKFRVVTTYNMRSSNRGDIVTDTAFGRNITAGGRTMSGTSQATAIITSRLISKNKK